MIESESQQSGQAGAVSLKNSPLFLAALIGLMALLPHISSVFYPLVWDDAFFIETNKSVLNLQPVSTYFTDPETLSSNDFYNRKIYRPLRTLSFALLYDRFGADPMSFHLLNVLLHAGCSILVFFIGLRLLSSVRAAWLGAALFAVHPAHVEAVAWVSSLADPLSTFFFLLIFYIFLTQNFLLKIVAVILLLPLALLAKEMAITLPLLLVVAWWTQNPRPGEAFKVFTPIAISFAVAAVYFFWRAHVLSAFGQAPLRAESVLTAFLHVHLVISEYLQMLLFPVSLCSLRDQIPAEPWRHATALLSMVLIALVLVRGYRDRGARRSVLLPVIGFLITLLPVLHFLPVLVHVAERFAYLPSVFFCLLMGEGERYLRTWSTVSGSPRRRIFYTVALGAVIGLFALKTLQVTHTWRSQEAVFLSQIQCDNPAPNAWLNFGHTATGREDWPVAELSFEKFLEREPGNASALDFVANAELNQKKWEEAERHARQGLTLSESSPMVWNILGSALMGQGRYAEAEEAYLRALAIYPEFRIVLVNLNQALLAQGKEAQAREIQQRLELLQP